MEGGVNVLSPEMIAKIRVNLHDPDSSTAIWKEDDLLNCIVRAVSDLSRVLPDEKLYDHTLVFTVTNEDWTSAAAGTWVTLANSMIKPESETVKNVAGTTTYTRDTDYTMDYAGGKITITSTGSMATLTAYRISYTKLQIGLSIASIKDTLLKIKKVEYPVGQTPQPAPDFELYGSYLTLKSGTSASQSQLSAGKHVWVYYQAEQTAPTATGHGSYPRFLDEVVVMGAESYALFQLAISIISTVKTDIASIKSIIDNVSDATAPLAAATSALDGVAAKLTAAETALTANTTTLEGVDAKLTNAETALTAVGTRVTAGVSFLTDGKPLINKANKGNNVAENYGNYANAEAAFAADYANEGRYRVDIAEALVAEASQYVAEGTQRRVEADALITQANQHVAVANGYITQCTNKADRYIRAIQSNLTLLERVKADADYRRTEFWKMLSDKVQTRRTTGTASVRQGVQP